MVRANYVANAYITYYFPIHRTLLAVSLCLHVDRHFSYDNEIELIQLIAPEMQKEGSNEEDLDSYLNTKLM